MSKKIKPEDLEVNLLYMMTQSFDLILRDVERRIELTGRNEEGKIVTFRHDKKKQFREYLDSIKDIVARIHRSEALNEVITQDIYAESAKNNYKSVSIWQQEANELARLLLLYADKSTTDEAVNKIHSFMRSLPGEDIVTEDVLKNFYLKKL